jgi:hypothetical protein
MKHWPIVFLFGFFCVPPALARPPAEVGEMMRQKTEHERQLEAVFQQIDGEAPPAQKAKASEPPVVSKPALVSPEIVGSGLPSRLLYFKLDDSVVRFRIGDDIESRALDAIVASLKTSCLQIDDESSCSSRRTSSVSLSERFLVGIEVSARSRWPASAVPTKWRLICLDASGSCLSPSTKIRRFKLTTEEPSKTDKVIAFGFDSKLVKRAHRGRVPASDRRRARRFERVYITVRAPGSI